MVRDTIFEDLGKPTRVAEHEIDILPLHGLPDDSPVFRDTSPQHLQDLNPTVEKDAHSSHLKNVPIRVALLERLHSEAQCRIIASAYVVGLTAQIGISSGYLYATGRLEEVQRHLEDVVFKQREDIRRLKRPTAVVCLQAWWRGVRGRRKYEKALRARIMMRWGIRAMHTIDDIRCGVESPMRTRLGDFAFPHEVDIGRCERGVNTERGAITDEVSSVDVMGGKRLEMEDVKPLDSIPPSLQSPAASDTWDVVPPPSPESVLTGAVADSLHSLGTVVKTLKTTRDGMEYFTPRRADEVELNF